MWPQCDGSICSMSLETLPPSRQCPCRPLRVVVEVVVLDVFDWGIAVVAHGRNGYPSFQCEVNPDVTERVPNQGFVWWNLHFALVDQVLFWPGRQSCFYQHLKKSISPNSVAEFFPGCQIAEEQIGFGLWFSDFPETFNVWCDRCAQFVPTPSFGVFCWNIKDAPDFSVFSTQCLVLADNMGPPYLSQWTDPVPFRTSP